MASNDLFKTLESSKPLITFAGGEVSPLMDARSDLEKTAWSCRQLTNYQCDVYGVAVRRPGTQYIAAVK